MKYLLSLFDISFIPCAHIVYDFRTPGSRLDILERCVSYTYQKRDKTRLKIDTGSKSSFINRNLVGGIDRKHR